MSHIVAGEGDLSLLDSSSPVGEEGIVTIPCNVQNGGLSLRSSPTIL